MFPEGRALEFLLAAVIALVVVGPKDLPVLMRKLGQFIGKMRAMAAEFRASFDEMARQSELDELRKEVEAMRQAQFADISGHAGASEVHEAVADIHQSLTDASADLTNAEPVSAFAAAPADPVAAPEPVASPKPRAKRTKPAATPDPAGKPRAARAKKTAEPGA